MVAAEYEPSLTEQKQYWDQRWDQTRTPNEWSLRRGEIILNFLRSLPLDQPKILDLGCGTGWFTEQLSHLGPATGIDLSERAIEVARFRYPHLSFIAGDLLELPLFAEHFDVVVSQEVIAHVLDQVAYINRAADTLKPGGYLVITTVNKFVQDRLDFGPDPPEHIKKWLTRRALERLLRPRFRVLRSTTILPMGNQGILRLINSYKLNTALGRIVPERHLTALKERVGLGWTRIILAQKKS